MITSEEYRCSFSQRELWPSVRGKGSGVMDEEMGKMRRTGWKAFLTTLTSAYLVLVRSAAMSSLAVTSGNGRSERGELEKEMMVERKKRMFR